MADGTIPPELQGKYLDVIIFESERLEKLTQSLLELNKYGTKGTYLDLSVFDLNALIKRTLLMFEGRCKEKMVSFHLILTGEELYVKADSAKIDQVMHLSLIHISVPRKRYRYCKRSPLPDWHLRLLSSPSPPDTHHRCPLQ